ncbi:hypothetical protein PT974_00571 [Cladobotryum mycophilum]|uniref:Cleavage/polyadenylation specificity factor A subunit N-terminal domain-containing protein n=1 Tax=Cladobotryum mycophilum TaxID=491253 RepID=A0ABR0T1I1_9HYPO
MAFQTSFLRDGEWITETVNLQAALKASAAPQAASDPLPEPPVCGILSQTIVESPIVHWVLPVRLRSKEHNDIAFIGDHSVQISELQKDGQVHEILRKSDFGPKIRSAVVLGDSLEHGLDDDGPGNTIKSESPSGFDSGFLATHEELRTRTLPPQLLVLMLETGQLLFIFVRERPGASLEFFITKYESPTALLYLGYHLAVDPTSRYIAAASPDGVVVIYELEALSNLNDQYVRQESLRPVKSVRVRAIQGVIHKLEFLFPRLEDDYHIILIMIVIRKEGNPDTPVSRMITFKTAFFAVSSHFIGVVKYALSGSPEFELLPNDSPACTKLHHGTHEPLWTAWARPFRRKKYFEKTDIIYLAREDGAVIHLEIDANEMLPSVTNVGCLETNIDTAFTTAYDIFSDVLIIGGDSGPGGIWKLAPRSELEQVSILPNWSPVVDITTTNEHSAWGPNAADVPAIRTTQRSLPNSLRKPDSIFSASGRGLKGNITHWRWGVQARIGLDIEIGEPVRQAWAFTIDHQGSRGLYGLLALPHSSLVLRFSEDLGYVEPLSSENTPFDITSRTLHAIQVSETIIQVTETSISLIGSTESSRCFLEEALDVAGVTAENAFCLANIVTLSTHTGQQSRLHVMRAEGAKFSNLSSWDAKGEVTCISIFTVSTNHFIVAASMHDCIPWISIYSLTGTLIVERPVGIEHGAEGGEGLANLEALTSISVVCQAPEEVDLILGSRCGRLVTARISKESDEQIIWTTEVVGVARVDVFPASGRFDGMPTVLACCDNNLILMTGFSHRECKFLSRHFIWPTDSNDASLPSPPIHSVFQIPHSLSGDAVYMSLMILTGSKLLLADIGPQVGHVPRSIPLYGTPTRIIFSQMLKCLVVALLDGDRPTLAFVDPETGAIISVPTNKDKTPDNYISGLGIPGDRIYGLHEWQYIKDGKTFYFILVTTKDGKLIIVSTEKMDSRRNGRQIKYWTRYKKDLRKPIYSIVGDAEGLLYCVDRTLHWDVLDLAEKKLKPMKEFELDSPATSLRVVNGKVFALTTMHSLERGYVAGIWIPWGQRNKEFEVVFEGILPFSVRRFARAHIRPPWQFDVTQQSYGTLPSAADGTDIIGVAMDGSMQRFTILSLDLWRLLSLIQKLAQSSTVVSPLAHHQLNDDDDDDDNDMEMTDLEPQPHPKSMHIDGDLLKRCLTLRALERLIGTGPSAALFCKYLDSLEGGRYTEDFRSKDVTERQEGYLELGYKILDFLVAPIM